jgi:Flp pilus assembly protein TadB
MSWAISWALLAGAAWLAPSARASVTAPVSPLREPRRVPLRVLQVVVALATATGCVAVLGPPHGLLAGCVLAPASVYLVGRLAARTVRAPPGRELALSLDLVAAGLRSGQPVSAALVLAAAAAGPPSAAALAQVAGLLRLGADPVEAWRIVADDDVLAPVAQAACRSADSGIRLARGLEQIGEDVRAQVRAAAEARAHRAGVLAMAPLGLCFLPAFVCLGVVPVVVGIAQGVFGALP